jgi:hypothetical protein
VIRAVRRQIDTANISRTLLLSRHLRLRVASQDRSADLNNPSEAPHALMGKKLTTFLV